jgi:hypothetical protein
MTTAPATASSLRRDANLEESIQRFVSERPDVRSIAASFPADDIIATLDDHIRNDPAFARGERAHRFAFEMLLQVGDYDEFGFRSYTNPQQVELFIEYINYGMILNQIHLVDARFYDRVVPAIESVFETENGPYYAAMSALGQIGSAAKSSLPILKNALVDTQAVNPGMSLEPDKIEQYIEESIPEGWRDEYREFLKNPNPDNRWGWATPEQSIIRFRSSAALARLRIDISLLPEDLATYRTLDALGQRAGALAIVGAGIETEGAFDGSASTSAAAAEFLADVYSRDDARASKMETLAVFGAVLASEDTPDEVKRAWQDAMVRLMVVDTDPEFHRHATRMLGR